MNVSDWILVTVLLLPGILVMAQNERDFYSDILADEAPPPFLLRLLNHMVISFPLAVLGLFFYKKIGFTNALNLTMDWLVLLLSLICALTNIATYYLYFKKSIPVSTYHRIEKSRQKTWIGSRCLYGGIVEEVMFRFGLVSFFIWFGNLFIDQENVSIWIANVASSLLFALAHLPGIYQLKIPLPKWIISYTMGINLMVGLVCGWLYWNYGLGAAIFCHMTFHIVWYLFEKIEAGKRVTV